MLVVMAMATPSWRVVASASRWPRPGADALAHLHAGAGQQQGKFLAADAGQRVAAAQPLRATRAKVFSTSSPAAWP
jgi:hypothetical protein